jgi:hypothetical protein
MLKSVCKLFLTFPRKYPFSYILCSLFWSSERPRQCSTITSVAVTPSRSSGLPDIRKTDGLLAIEAKCPRHGTAIAVTRNGEARRKFCEGDASPSLLKNSTRRETGRNMFYLGFGSISGMIHLIARLPVIGRAAAIFLIVTAMIAPVR